MCRYGQYLNLSNSLDSNNNSTHIVSAENIIDKKVAKSIAYLKNGCIFAMLLASNIIKI